MSGRLVACVGLRSSDLFLWNMVFRLPVVAVCCIGGAASFGDGFGDLEAAGEVERRIWWFRVSVAGSEE